MVDNIEDVIAAICHRRSRWALGWLVAHASTLDPDGSSVSACIPIKPGQHVEIRASYASRGLEQWRYEPTEGVGRLKDFSLRMRTNFHDIDIHPINYALISSAFFVFHLLFAYLVDHIAIEWAFTVCSLVSVALCTSYLRLVVSSSFAFREAALAQVVYLIGFSLAHFWEGYTGLTVTVLATLTLFLLMQLTGRIRWSEVFAARPPSAASVRVPS